MQSRRRSLLAFAFVAAAFPPARPIHASEFTAFESGQMRPLALAADGNRLFAVNTPDNRLEIFDVTPTGFVAAGSVAVGLEPVAVAVRSADEVWVVNHLSDSVSVVDVGSPVPQVRRTLLVGDEPRDIIFAGTMHRRAFITAAHRGQNRPGDPQLTTAGVGRADVWVFDTQDLGATAGGVPLTILSLFGDTLGPLASSPDGATVYAGVLQSGNQTTVVHEQAICDGGQGEPPCEVDGQMVPGGLPAPNSNFRGARQPEASLIVRFNAQTNAWEDALQRDWRQAVRFSLPDRDVFAIDATASPPTEIESFTHIGTLLYAMIANPMNGKLYVSNTEARNEVRFEGDGGGVSSVRGRLHESRITVLDGNQVQPRHLNPHIDYGVHPSPAGVAERSLALPGALAVSKDGKTLYVAGFGSSAIGVFETDALESNTFVPTAAAQIALDGGGPSGLVLDEARQRLYVMTRFDNAITVLDTTTRAPLARLPLHSREPASVVAGRRFLYDARLTSSNGEAACASCHLFGDTDGLAWDLGDPDAPLIPNPNLSADGLRPVDFHPLKGPMTTQTLRGMAHHGPMHWRGDRTGGSKVGGDPLDARQAFLEFNETFAALLGRGAPLSNAQMAAFADFALQILPPPNPLRALDNSLSPDEEAGRDFFFHAKSDGGFECVRCHVLDPSRGFFGTDGRIAHAGGTQFFKVPQLRNLYQKVGMFGLPNLPFFPQISGAEMGEQIRGFGFQHDGATDTLFHFLHTTPFTFADGDTQRRQVEKFLFAFDSDLAPIVGQQMTLTAATAATALARIDLLEARAVQGECDVIAKGVVAGESRGWSLLSSNTYRSDRSGEPTVSSALLRQRALLEGVLLTYTSVPLGSGARLGIDRDADNVLDGDEVAAGTNPADPSSFPMSPTPTATATPTVTSTATRTATATASLTPSPTVTATATPTQTHTETQTQTPSASATATASPENTATATWSVTATLSPLPSNTPTVSIPCPGDCDGNGEVTIDELVRGVNLANGVVSPQPCAAFTACLSTCMNELRVALRTSLTTCFTTGVDAVEGILRRAAE